LEASLARRLGNHADTTGARIRLEAKLAAGVEAHRAHRERGEKPDLEGQSLASLVALVLSYPPGEVPPEVLAAARTKAEDFGQDQRRGTHSIFAKMIRQRRGDRL